MKKLFLLAFAVLFASHAYAFNDGRTPLVVVHFGAGQVDFERDLFMAMSEAVKVKPEVMFDIVGAGGAETSTVVQSKNRMGVPQSRMTVTPDASMGSDVRVYVR